MIKFLCIFETKGHPMAQDPHVVIVGGGFGGLAAAKVLSKKGRCRVSLIDRRNYHLFQPLLYQVATAALSPADIATPIRSVLSKFPNTQTILGNVDAVDLNNKKVHLDSATTLSYDFLILACGANHSYFGHNEWEEHAPGLKTLEQATEIRRRILLAFELAENSQTDADRKYFQTFVIVGAGPTGVELAGSIAEISRYTLEKDFRRIDPAATRVILIEAGARILPTFSEDLAKRAARDLEKLGVQIWTSSKVTEVSSEGVKLGDETLRAKTIIWAAGVEPSSLALSLATPLDRLKRVLVEPDLSLKDHPEVFVIGDMACALDENGKPYPGLAPVAMQQGRYVAKMIVLSIEQKPRYPFRYIDKGSMATVGRKSAIVQIKQINMGGFLAWLIWLFIHIYYLIGFKNRIMVFAEWAWSYLTFKRGARLILGKNWQASQSQEDSLKHVS